MKAKPTLLLTLTALLLLGACGAPAAEAPVADVAQAITINADEFVSMLPNDNLTIVDVRTTQELQETGIIAGAIHIPLDQLASHLDQLPGKDSQILVYCRTGNRSSQAQELLIDAGYSDVLNLAGGIGGWTGAGEQLIPATQFFTP